MLRMIKGMAAGAVIGVAVTAVMLPQLDRRTQRNLKRVGRRAMNMAEDACDMMIGYMR
ncbi:MULTISPECIES: YtxH domain-containing protein [unclassified Clostridium]|uniref:YtxH domain-containing protein n=1 Tax=unclassified Clostridium TaxID=2614128 RepID=UPI0025BD106A|nr:YtxH domain-containing protein [Clostridium sp.]MCI6691359.1 YtxH domain-containing protein [Clostridium sp.]MDY2631613.1 YtxH domain-containing protein [Clostridium sp.]MDY6227009.1 YtxH domain-containing protein [Clostridium sp.]